MLYWYIHVYTHGHRLIFLIELLEGPRITGIYPKYVHHEFVLLFIVVVYQIQGDFEGFFFTL